MLLESLIDSWKEVRAGLLLEISLIPADQFSFRATAETRSITEIIHHIVEAEKFLIGEVCRPDTNFARRPFKELIKEYASEVKTVEGKDDLAKLLEDSLKSTEAMLRSFGEEALKEDMLRLDGKTMPKLAFLHFTINHETYHRGQITVYERLLKIEPAMTARVNEFLAAQSKESTAP
jgi:uncharacterized damage-inducible protein DinB